MNKIDYETVLRNLQKMINLLEFDSMRSAGKAKMNAGHLEAMWNLVDRYEVILKKQPTPVNKEG